MTTTNSTSDSTSESSSIDPIRERKRQLESLVTNMMQHATKSDSSHEEEKITQPSAANSKNFWDDGDLPSGPPLLLNTLSCHVPNRRDPRQLQNHEKGLEPELRGLHPLHPLRKASVRNLALELELEEQEQRPTQPLPLHTHHTIDEKEELDVSNLSLDVSFGDDEDQEIDKRSKRTKERRYMMPSTSFRRNKSAKMIFHESSHSILPHALEGINEGIKEEESFHISASAGASSDSLFRGTTTHACAEPDNASFSTMSYTAAMLNSDTSSDDVFRGKTTHACADPHNGSFSTMSFTAAKNSAGTHKKSFDDSIDFRSFFGESKDDPDEVVPIAKEVDCVNDEKFDDDKFDEESVLYVDELKLWLLRLVLLILFTSVGVYSTVGAYFLLSAGNNENEMTEENLALEAVYLLEINFQNNLEKQLQGLERLATDISSYAHRSNSLWPFVTIRDFEFEGEHLRNSVNAEMLAFLPLVTSENKDEWGHYSTSMFPVWINESLEYAQQQANETSSVSADTSKTENITPVIFSGYEVNASAGPFFPLWQSSPVCNDVSLYNLNILSQPALVDGLRAVIAEEEIVLDNFFVKSNSDLLVKDTLQTCSEKKSMTVDNLSIWFYPIVAWDTSILVGVLMSVQDWGQLFVRNYANRSAYNILGYRMQCVLGSRNGDMITYEIHESSIKFIGKGDLHDPNLDHRKHTINLTSGKSSFGLNEDYGFNVLNIYPATLEQESNSDQNQFYYIGAIIFFSGCLSIFLYYDAIHRRLLYFAIEDNEGSVDDMQSIDPEKTAETSVENRGSMLMRMDTPKFTNRVSRKNITDTCNASAITDAFNNSTISMLSGTDAVIKQPPKLRLRKLLKTRERSGHDKDNDKPVADYFPDCTIMFADVIGFTAWTSTREPTQVFTLLQRIFQEFDRAARMRGVFKVETIGDSYVAVAGFPQPNNEHALAMAGFALECRELMKDVTKAMANSLGPDTLDLCMRFGLHSGPLTAGVLAQGAKGRFKLFGDTMDTAAKMESTGRPDLIQLSAFTAAMLEKAGRGDWLCPRSGKVNVEGKGDMATFWLNAGHSKSRRYLSSNTAYTAFIAGDPPSEHRDPNAGPDKKETHEIDYDKQQGEASLSGQDMNGSMMNFTAPLITKDERHERLIDWNVNLLLDLLKKVVARRRSAAQSNRLQRGSSAAKVTLEEQELFLSDNTTKGRSCVDDVTEVIKLPAFDPESFVDSVSPEKVTIEDGVVEQLQEYVTIVAGTYRDNPFHNYEHACHVQMSMMKLLQRVTTPEQINYSGQKEVVASDAHDYTYGIASDPLTQFTVVFCALIHDCDHAGVSNAQLVTENANIASLYQCKSIAEQNSIDLAWGLLMGPEFSELRDCIYADRSEFQRFRQLVVNVVLATDIFDKELSALRKKRWNEAFHELPANDSFTEYTNRKATIVIEHFIQASDVAHTMQHWNVYKKWNERLFFEMYLAYATGRSATDPGNGWFRGELWFFDNYVIPLAKKLEECGVFGVSSAECLNYALENRTMWEKEGEAVVKSMLESEFCRNLREAKTEG